MGAKHYPPDKLAHISSFLRMGGSGGEARLLGAYTSCPLWWPDLLLGVSNVPVQSSPSRYPEEEGVEAGGGGPGRLSLHPRLPALTESLPAFLAAGVWKVQVFQLRKAADLKSHLVFSHMWVGLPEEVDPLGDVSL